MSTSASGTPTRYIHGRYEHEHAHADVPHNHLMREICSAPECDGYATHDLHPVGGFDPIKLCCFRRRSEHTGPQCPDGKVMCCLCFSRVTVEELSTDPDDGMKVDVCKPCRAAEEEMERRFA